MNHKKSPIFLLSLILFIVNILHSQPEIQRPQQTAHTSGTVMGTIVDAHNVPLQYASVNVKRVADSVTAQFGLTDEAGKFFL